MAEVPASSRMSDDAASSAFAWSDVRVCVHPTEVVVLRGTRADVAAHCLAFLSAAFFPGASTVRAERLLSLSRVHEDVTLLADPASIEGLPQPALGLTRDEGRWGALQLWEGDAAVGITGVVAAVAGGLGDVDVLLYISTVNTDILVVPLDRLEEARQRCEAALERLTRQARGARKDRRRHTQNQDDPDHDHDHDRDHDHEGADETDGDRTGGGRTWSVESAGSARSTAQSDDSQAQDWGQIPVMLSAEAGAVCLGRIPADRAGLAMHYMCGAVLGIPHRADEPLAPVFALVESPLDGTTVVMDAAEVRSTPSAECLEMWPAGGPPGEWAVIRISQGSGGHSTEGVMRPLVKAMARAEVSIYYLSTMSDDFMLVPRECLADGIQALRDSKDIFVEYCDVEDSTTPNC
jgi:hypothetical protein